MLYAFDSITICWFQWVPLHTASTWCPSSTPWMSSVLCSGIMISVSNRAQRRSLAPRSSDQTIFSGVEAKIWAEHYLRTKFLKKYFENKKSGLRITKWNCRTVDWQIATLNGLLDPPTYPHFAHLTWQIESSTNLTPKIGITSFDPFYTNSMALFPSWVWETTELDKGMTSSLGCGEVRIK